MPKKGMGRQTWIPFRDAAPAGLNRPEDPVDVLNIIAHYDEIVAVMGVGGADGALFKGKAPDETEAVFLITPVPVKDVGQEYVPPMIGRKIAVLDPCLFFEILHEDAAVSHAHDADPVAPGLLAQGLP